MEVPDAGVARRDPVVQPSPMERRRSQRIAASISVMLGVEADPPVSAIAIDVSRHGARLRSPRVVPPDATLWLQHEPTSAWVRARVVRASEPQPDGSYELGVEFLDDPSCRFVRDVYADPRD